MKKSNNPLINRDYLIRISIEMFSVVFAVILALLIDEWRSNKTNHRLAETAYTNIKTELTANQKALTSMLVSHDSLLAILDSILVKIEKKGSSAYFTLNGFRLELLSDAAWEATKNTSAINYMDFNDIMDISSVYDAQTIYRNLMDDFFDEQLVGSRDDSQKDKINQLYSFNSFLTRFVAIGHQLEDLYVEVINELDSIK
jgi:hypothetical protein